MKAKLLILIAVVITLIFFYFFHIKLSKFDITNFNQDITDFESLNYLTWSKSRNAKNYTINVYLGESLIKSYSTSDNKILINDLPVNENDNIYFEIIASNDFSKYTIISNKYTYSLPTIRLSNNETTYDKGVFSNDIDIEVLNQDYQMYLEIVKNNDIIYSDDYTESINFNAKINEANEANEADIDEIYGTYKIILSLILDDNKKMVHMQNIDVNPTEITDLVMTSPLDNTEIAYEDFEFEFSGGVNADTFMFSILDENDNAIIEETPLENKSITINANLLDPNSSYRIIVKAYHSDALSYIKTFNYYFKTASENTVPIVSSTRKSGDIGINRPIRLFNNKDGVQIHYTTDGSTPSCESTLYQGNIYISENTTVKAIACYDDMKNSDITTFTYNPVVKQKAIYLSPSNQYLNIGHSSTSYTTEMEIMNLVSDYIEKKLVDNDIIVYRNRSDMDLDEVVINSSSYDVDLHLAIHSNSFNSYERGVETWIYDYDCTEAYDAATKIQEALMSIYPVAAYDRGVKESASIGGLRENKPTNVTNGVLVEIAFHDNYYDAKWIMNNIELIGNTIADAVIEYLNEI
ncbi:MAG: FN3 associated domain-containing protein [Bacilli bacterium]|nr:FN3 associated domain-containing protein [Bacilli bacterium]